MRQSNNPFALRAQRPALVGKGGNKNCSFSHRRRILVVRLESCPPLLRCRTPPPRRPPLFPPTVFCAKRALVAKIDARRRSSLHRRRKIFLQLRFRSSRRRRGEKKSGPPLLSGFNDAPEKSYICILKLLFLRNL